MGRACNHRVWLQRAIQEAKKAHAAIACKTYKGYLEKTSKKFAAYQSALDLYSKVPLHVGCGCSREGQKLTKYQIRPGLSNFACKLEVDLFGRRHGIQVHLSEKNF